MKHILNILIIKKWEMKSIFLLTLTLSIGCGDFIDIGPPKSELISEVVFQKDVTAHAAMTGIYSEILSSGTTYRMALFTGLYSDELEEYSLTQLSQALYSNSLAPSFNSPSSIWNDAYKSVYRANAVIEGCNGSTSLSENVKQQLIAEAKFVRAFWYYYLVNLYGDVPLLLTTDYKVNSIQDRSNTEIIYNQIVEDLQDAQNVLSADYIDAGGNTGTNERVRPNKFAALALLSRVYLVLNQHELAESTASQILERTDLYDLVALDNVFLKNSRETIWQIPVSSSASTFSTQESRAFVLTSRPLNTALSPLLINVIEEGDNRKMEWIGVFIDGQGEYQEEFYFPHKYKLCVSCNSTYEYVSVLRLSEIYLIRAEARARRGNTNGALSDMNAVRGRAGLADLELSAADVLLEAILKERQIELFTEWGHRWLDLKRSEDFNERMVEISGFKGGTWSPYKALWPIDQTEINRNPYLTQNTGYDNVGSGGTN